MSEELGERDRRRYLRVAADENLECDIADVGVVHIVGIGSKGNGIRVITNTELPTDSELDVALTWQEESLFKGKAKAVWQETWDFEFCSRHVAGIELLGQTAEERKALVERLPVVREPGPLPEEML